MRIKTKRIEEVLNNVDTLRINGGTIYFDGHQPNSQPWFYSDCLDTMISVEHTTQPCFKYVRLSDYHLIPAYVVEEVYEN